MSKVLDDETNGCLGVMIDISDSTDLGPLSPNIISQDPKDQSQSKVVHSTEDSEIYTQIPARDPSTCTSSSQLPQDHQLSIHSRAVSVSPTFFLT